MTKAKSLQEVKQLREANKPVLFNMAVALDVVKTTAPKTKGTGVLSTFSTDLINLFKEAGTQLAVNQVVAAFKANDIEVTSKQVADRCWLLAKKGILVKGDAKGTYVYKSDAQA
jgi:hypothetical protein